jgi:hypothetical protein
MKKIYVIKANGKPVPFDPNKVIGTCIRAGTSEKQAKQIARKTQVMIRSGLTTRDIYRLVLQNISKVDESKVIKHKYRLKEAIMKMGPIGFPFESYISQILSNYGYEIKGVRMVVKGECVKHEIDVIAKSKNKKYMVECKYHHRRGIHTGLKESLYTHARFLDLQKQFDGEILSCNTKLSDDAFAYATCIGQNLLCWRHPPDGGLEKMIEDKGLYPITMVSLNKTELMQFSKIKFMIARDLLTVDLRQLSRKTNIPYTRLQRLYHLVSRILA